MSAPAAGLEVGRSLRLGTRGSALAMVQARYVARELEARRAGLAVEIVTITTRGDVRTDVPLSVIGGRGVFAKELETALREDAIDLAVHSSKDLPSTLADDMQLAAFPPREDARDVLVSHAASTIDALPDGALVGTSSPRRACILRALRPDLDLRDIRGNVDTRLRKLDAGEYDAIVLAAAGLRRLGLADRITAVIPADVMIPAVGQGAIGIEVRADDTRTAALCAALDDRPTHLAVVAERAFLARLGAGCSAPAAAHATLADDVLTIAGCVGDDTGRLVRASLTGPAVDGRALGRALAERLIAEGGEELIAAAGMRPAAEPA